ncbi:hypothetical protein RCL1_007210 [Eukaryota sp. TZLM3-RCL]
MTSTFSVAEDLEVRFDVPVSSLQERPGECRIDQLSSVEDTKGGLGLQGILVVTNLRIIWFNPNKPKQNLSIGWNTVRQLTIQAPLSSTRASSRALHVNAFCASSAYEFVFTHCVPGTPRLFSTVQAVHRAYDTSRLYRELKLRGSLFSDGRLNVLPLETIYEQIPSVWNLAADQGNLGSLVLTNLRIVWHANATPNFNVSVPYLKISQIKIRKSKFGPALVVQTSAHAGGFVLGFRVDPMEKLQNVNQAIMNLYKLYCDSPIYGIQYTMEESPPPLEQLKVTKQTENLALRDDEFSSSAGAYVTDGGEGRDRPPVYSTELGLAIEALHDGVSVKDLWQIIQ